MNRYEIKRNPKYRKIANNLIRTEPDLKELRCLTPKIAYLSSQEEKKTGGGRKLVCGECKKVPDNMQWICPYDFLITIYEQNIYGFTDKQLEILIHHELKHIGIKVDGNEPSFDIAPHDFEDFRAIIDKHGLDWNATKED